MADLVDEYFVSWWKDEGGLKVANEWSMIRNRNRQVRTPVKRVLTRCFSPSDSILKAADMTIEAS